ncbi:Signal transduction histidine kinase [Mariprofundus ferrinatatus]|uniref:Sensory/regulatory protein RpfC n=1 Tax=Mariprofundus ferrinatatus TaxID=1921087 RepID=A0A2K8L4Y6_9PROT|nr:response regulator [Mariprofundus ferrinatatus]ATX82385.1 Signal transduction histidine kinase [Mariprofundus ferrinatatus]
MNETELKSNLSMRKGIRWKLMIAGAGTIVAIVSLLTVLQVASQKEVMKKSLDAHTSFLKAQMDKKADRASVQMAGHLTDLVATFRLSLAYQYVSELVRDVDDLKYVILMQEDQPKIAFGPNLSSEIRQEILRGHASEFAVSQTGSIKHDFVVGDLAFMESIVPIRIEGEQWGVLRLGFSLQELNQSLKESEAYVAEEINNLVLQATLTALLFLFVGSILVYFLAGMWTRPIRQLVAFSHEIANGDFDATPHISTRTNDEIGVLVSSLEEMAASLRESYAKLEDHSLLLEEQVEIRTRELAEARDKAIAATQSKSEFLANMSHEIRTPMNAVIGLTHLTLDRETDKQQRNYLTKTLEASEVLLSIINDILDFSKIEAHKMELDRIDFEMDEVMHNLASIGGVRASEKGLDFLIDFPPHMPRLNGDPHRLGQVLLNLVNNAVKFTEEGQVIVCARLQQSDVSGHLIRFTVTDTGIGLTEEQQSRLFQAFTQADSSITRRFGGTGLGLAICKQLVEMMHGEIGLDSVEGKGSSFYFTARFEAAKESESQTFDVPHELQRLRTLVVDDNPTSKLILSRFIESFGMRPECVSTVKEAAKELKAADDPYGLMIVDWTLEETQGLETLGLIKKAARVKAFPPVILTANYGQSISDEDARAAGFAITLLKPVTASSILESIVSVFGYNNVSEQTQEQEKSAGKSVSLHGARLLLVEDNPINQMVAEGLLMRAGVSLFVAHNGQEAIDAVRSDSFDGVLMDMQMPVMDGLEATRIIRSEPAFADLPIIAMTANVLPSDVRDCFEAGMNDHIAKPIDPADLYSKLEKWISSFRLGESGISQSIEGGGLPKFEGIDTADGLRRVGGDPQHYRNILGKFVESQGDVIAELRQAMAGGDGEKAIRLMHSLKGVAGNIGAKTLHAEAARLEGLLQDGGTIAEDDYSSVEKSMAEVITSISSGIGGEQAEIEPEFPEGQEEAVEAELSGEFDREQADAVLARMRAMLEDYNGDAVDLLGELEAVLANTAIAAKLPRMKKYLDGYDFDAALLLLEGVEQDVRKA